MCVDNTLGVKMKLFFDFLPIILFFVVFKLSNIYLATFVAIIASVMQVISSWWRKRKIDTMQTLTMCGFLIFGGTTLCLHDAFFIKLKPTVIYWLFALIFFGSQLFTKKTFLERMAGGKLSLPVKTWQTLNFSWGIFFIALGILNLYVSQHFSTNTWVNFKLFGILGIIFLFGLAQSLFMAKYLKEEKILQHPELIEGQKELIHEPDEFN
jgi:intracellular septation protein